jgi:hypothetical protein
MIYDAVLFTKGVGAIRCGFAADGGAEPRLTSGGKAAKTSGGKAADIALNGLG